MSLENLTEGKSTEIYENQNLLLLALANLQLMEPEQLLLGGIALLLLKLFPKASAPGHCQRWDSSLDDPECQHGHSHPLIG